MADKSVLDPAMSRRTASRSSRPLSRDTGFPEPFDHTSNTTLPHPDADLSPNACISSDDLTGDHALKRKRLSFLHRHKNKRSLAHGFISPQNELVSSVLTLTLSDAGGFSGNKGSDPQRLASNANASASTTSFRSKDGTESDQSKKDEETPPTSPDSMKPSNNKNGFLSKWRWG